MDISLWQIAIACVGCLLAGIMNASGGSGGLISVPALMLCGLDSHASIGTNKVQAVMSLPVAVYRYAKNGFIKPALAIPSGICGALGAILGARLSLLVSNRVLLYVMFAMVPICAWAILSGRKIDADRSEDVTVTPKLIATLCAIGLACGLYDGFYGPGSGTFLVVAIGAFTTLGVKGCAAHAKVINCSDNIAALVVFMIHGTCVLWLGILAGACAAIGAWIGSGAVIKNGSRFMKPLLLLALVLLIINAITKL